MQHLPNTGYSRLQITIVWFSKYVSNTSLVKHWTTYEDVEVSCPGEMQIVRGAWEVGIRQMNS